MSPQLTAFVEAINGEATRIGLPTDMLWQLPTTFVVMFASLDDEGKRRVISQIAAASGTGGSAQDRNGLDPKGAGPTREAGDAQ